MWKDVKQNYYFLCFSHAQANINCFLIFILWFVLLHRDFCKPVKKVNCAISLFSSSNLVKITWRRRPEKTSSRPISCDLLRLLKGSFPFTNPKGRVKIIGQMTSKWFYQVQLYFKKKEKRCSNNICVIRVNFMDVKLEPGKPQNVLRIERLTITAIYDNCWKTDKNCHACNPLKTRWLP